MFCAFVENTSKFFVGIHVIIYGRKSYNFEMLFSKYFLHGRFASSTVRVPHSLRYLLKGLQRIHMTRNYSWSYKCAFSIELCTLNKVMTNESPLKMMKDAFISP